MTQPIVETGHGIRLAVHIIPNAKQTGIIVERDGKMTMRVHAPPVKDKANREIVKWLSKKLRKPTSHVRIVAGIHSRSKAIEILDIDGPCFLKAIIGNAEISPRDEMAEKP